jgi:hypothetical protein
MVLLHQSVSPVQTRAETKAAKLRRCDDVMAVVREPSEHRRWRYPPNINGRATGQGDIL